MQRIRKGEAVDWVERMTAVIDYLEQHLETDISKAEISRIAACPYMEWAYSPL
jgi:hypothetical protein